MGTAERITRNPQILTQQVSEQTVLLNPATGKYFSIDDIGSRVGELCDGSLTIAEIAERIHDEYDAPINLITTDVIELVTEFCDEKLVVSSR